MLKLFAYGHLEREDLQAVSKPFAELAERVVALVPAGPERTVSLRKLLEADAAAAGGAHWLTASSIKIPSSTLRPRRSGANTKREMVLARRRRPRGRTRTRRSSAMMTSPHRCSGESSAGGLVRLDRRRVYQMLHWAIGAEDGQAPTVVKADAMARVDCYIDYAAQMLDRVIAGSVISEAEANTAVIARALLSRDIIEASDSSDGLVKMIQVRELYRRKSWSWLRDPIKRDDAFEVLSEAGWIRHASIGTKGCPRLVWVVNPTLWKKA
jgi:hypothetical protein